MLRSAPATVAAGPFSGRLSPPSERLAWRAAPVVAAAVCATVYLALAPQSVDLAAHVYRAGLFGRQGFTIWDGGWYAGHHAPGYSVLFPPLAWLIGPRLAGVLGAVAAAALFEPLVHRHFGSRARWGALWFGVATSSQLFSGRMPFIAGVAVGLAALLAFQRGRPVLAVALAVACTVTSPVAGLFLALAGVAVALTGDRAGGGAVAAAAVVPPLVLAAVFPEGGYEPFSFTAFRLVPVFALLVAWALPVRERALRCGCLLFAAASVVAFLVHTPMGGNAIRLPSLFAGPLLACAVTFAGSSRRRTAALALLLAALAWYQWSATVGDVTTVAHDPAAQPGFYSALNRELARLAGPPGRVEIPFTHAHWEAAEVAPEFPLARGWERQLDVGRNPLFYGQAPLTGATYARWLSDHAVSWVALPRDVALDYSATGEAALIRRGLPYLRLRWSSSHWLVYEFMGPHALVAAAPGASITAERLTATSLTLRVSRPGRARVAVEWSPYWRLRGGCVRQDGQWTAITARRAGAAKLEIAFSAARIFDHGERCG